MPFLAQLFFVLSLSYAATDDVQLAELITHWNHEDKDKVSKLEQLFALSRMPHVKQSAALLLAFLPESSLQKKPHEYAHYVLKNQKKIDNSFSLYRIAGDGYFQSASFKAAAALYKEAQSLQSISVQDKVYFLYKEAWCYLNLKKPELAYFLIIKSLDLPSSTMLRQPMVVDLGQSFGEAVFTSKISLQMKNLFKPKSQQEEAWFVEGLLKAYRRFPNKTPQLYRMAFDDNWINGAFPWVFEFEQISQRGSCEVINMKKNITAAATRDKRFFNYLNTCVEALLLDSKVKPVAFKEAASWYEIFKVEDPLHKWTLQKLYERSLNSLKSCQTAVANSSIFLDKQPIWLVSWLHEATASCKASKQQNIFETELAKNSKKIIDTEIYTNLKAEFSESLTLSLLIEGEKVWSNSAFNELFSAYLDSLGPASGTALLVSNCPLLRHKCFEIWKGLAQSNILWMRSFIDSQSTPKEEASAWISLLEYRTQLADYQKAISDLPELVVASAPLSEDVLQLKKIENYRALITELNGLQDQNIFDEIEKFQNMLIAASTRKWSTVLTQKRMQYELSATTQKWQEVLKKRGKTHDEKQQWKMLVKAMNSWRPKI